MKPVYLSLVLLFLSVASSAQDKSYEYCQIAAESGVDEDPIVEKFLFGYKNKKYADSLLKAFKEEIEVKRRWNLYVTDALNFLGDLGWELHTVYSISPSRSTRTQYFYVMKKSR